MRERLIHRNAYLEMVLKRLKLLFGFFTTGFGFGPLACPFIPFFPGSASLPLLSTAIFYCIQLSKGSLPTGRRTSKVDD
jgi:hypothetical protein